jgi:hypothetical protein
MSKSKTLMVSKNRQTNDRAENKTPYKNKTKTTHCIGPNQPFLMPVSNGTQAMCCSLTTTLERSLFDFFTSVVYQVKTNKQKTPQGRITSKHTGLWNQQ